LKPASGICHTGSGLSRPAPRGRQSVPYRKPPRACPQSTARSRPAARSAAAARRPSAGSGREEARPAAPAICRDRRSLGRQRRAVLGPVDLYAQRRCRRPAPAGRDAQPPGASERDRPGARPAARQPLAVRRHAAGGWRCGPSHPRRPPRFREGHQGAGGIRGPRQRRRLGPPTTPGRARGPPTTLPPCAPSWSGRWISRASAPATSRPTPTSPIP